jgi:hypothetical protein
MSRVLPLFVLFVACVKPAAPTVPEADAAAKDGVSALQTIDDSGEPSDTSAPPLRLRADAPSPSAALAVGFVRLDELRAGLTDPAALVHDTGDRFYPIVSGVLVVSSLTLRLQNGAWRPVRVAEQALAAAVQRTRAALLASRHVDADAFSLVEVPALQATLLLHHERGEAMLTPLEDEGSLAAGEPQPADAVFAALAALPAPDDL